jgi:alpha,alpha-trehalase
VSNGGSLDWLSWPRFDSPSVFAALLGDEAGSWRIAPPAPARAALAYVAGTNVLETRFETSSGALILTDAMSVASEEEQRVRLLPEREIVRVVTCVMGSRHRELLRSETGLRTDRARGPRSG